MKCQSCLRQISLRNLRFELECLLWFVYQRPAYQMFLEHSVSYHKVTKIYESLRKLIYHHCELESPDLPGEIEVNEDYFGGRKIG